MVTRRIWRACQGTNRSSSSWGPCQYQARWWVAVPYATTPWRRMCGHHARAYTHRWPILTSDPERDWNASRPAAILLAELNPGRGLGGEL